MSEASLSPALPRRRNISKIPIDRDRVKRNSEFFGRAFSQERPVLKDGEITYTIIKETFTLDYRFNKSKSDRLKKNLRLENKGNVFSLGRRAARLWYSMIYLAAVQGGGHTGTFRLKDIAELWHCGRSGRLYTDIKQTFLSLATFTPHYRNNKTGSGLVEWGYSFFDAWLIKGEGDGAVFSFEMNKTALGITSRWLKESNLSMSELKGGYLAIKVSELREDRGSPKYENFVERVRLLKPGGVKVGFEKVLLDWIKVGDDLLRQRKKCHALVSKFLAQARSEGEIKDFRLEVRGLKDWLKAWTVRITK
jgi:hypothetical protein